MCYLYTILGVGISNVSHQNSFNDLTRSGIYVWDYGSEIPTDGPDGISGASICVVYAIGAIFIQLAFSGYYSTDQASKIAVRCGYMNAGWRNWKVL